MQPFIVKLSVLSSKVTEFDRNIGKEFFESFGNSDILDADIYTAADIVRHGATVDLECHIEGTLTVACDRCLEPVTMEIETDISDSYTPDGEWFDFNQEVYDYALTALPLQCVHPDGECNPETIKFLANSNNI